MVKQSAYPWKSATAKGPQPGVGKDNDAPVSSLCLDNWCLQTAMSFVRAWGGQVDLWNLISLAETNVAYTSWIGRNLPTLVNCQPPLPAALHWLCIISCPGWCLLWDKEKLTVIQTVIQNTSTQLCSFHVDREMLLLEWLWDNCTFAHTWLPIEKLLFFVYVWCQK